jgi:hypothetical protein
MKGTSKSWKTEPLPANRARLKLDRSFDAVEWDALQQGVIPEEMEDKWFIYEEGGWLNFHRSWTAILRLSGPSPEDATRRRDRRSLGQPE